MRAGQLMQAWRRFLQRSCLQSQCAIHLRKLATQDDAILVCMPQLSPSMTSGKISRWLKAPGEQVRMYDIFMEVDTDTLTEPENKLGKFEGTVTMLIESQEDVFLQRKLVEEGTEVPVGTPVALVCEFEEDLQGLADYKIPVSNMYEEGGESPRLLTWQSYLKSDKGAAPGGCS